MAEWERGINPTYQNKICYSASNLTAIIHCAVNHRYVIACGLMFIVVNLINYHSLNVQAFCKMSARSIIVSRAIMWERAGPFGITMGTHS
jgi:hypothetical protein